MALQPRCCAVPEITKNAPPPVAVVGGGLIGLEVAASAAEIGAKVTVIEILPRLLARVCDEDTSERVHDAHRRRGVDIRLNRAVTYAQAEPDGRIALKTGVDETLIADVVVVGAGALPDDQLAAAAGFKTENGIIVDARCATSDPKIYAAGDVVRFPDSHGLVHREDWRHAQDQGARSRAAMRREPTRNIAAYRRSGRSSSISIFRAWDRRQRNPMDGYGGRALARPQSNFELTAHHITYALGINAQRDMAVVRRLIERGIAVDPAALTDSTKSLAEMLKAKA
jgi:3-phenylpropionate/trans-cinnamate dioxygenase ferredoxin reductase component